MIPTPDHLLRVLTGAPDGIASSVWLAGQVGCPAEDLAGPLAELHGSGQAEVWQAVAPTEERPGVLGIVLTRTLRTPRRRVRHRVQADGTRVVTGRDQDRMTADLQAARVEIRRGLEAQEAGPPPRTVTNRDPCGLPFPGLILLGERLPWPPPDWVRRRPCWGCRGRRLSVETYCLVCDRAGRSQSTWGKVIPEGEPVITAPATRSETAGLAGGSGEQAHPDPHEARETLVSAQKAQSQQERDKARARGGRGGRRRRRTG